jgi:hypothetical protein
MATPTGQIAFSDLNTELLRAGSTAQLNMNTAGVRLGFGSTSQLSISELKKAWGATITCGSITNKFGTRSGYDSSVSPAIGSMDSITYTPGNEIGTIQTGEFGTSYGGYFFLPGYLPTNVNRWCLADASRTIDSACNDSGIVYWSGYNMPTSGTVSFGIRWS